MTSLPSNPHPNYRPNASIHHPFYKIWVGMKSRCNNPNDRAYQWYGARGISVCPRWAESFHAFAEDMGPRPSSKHSIERIDNNGNYCPENCKWATQTEQCRNTRANVKISFGDQTKTQVEWTEILNASESTICQRLKHGWSAEKSVSTPLRKYDHDRPAVVAEMYLQGISVSEIAKKFGITRDRIFVILKSNEQVCRELQQRSVERANKAHELRLQGLSYNQIGKVLGCSKSLAILICRNSINVRIEEYRP